MRQLVFLRKKIERRKLREYYESSKMHASLKGIKMKSFEEYLGEAIEPAKDVPTDFDPALDDVLTKRAIDLLKQRQEKQRV